jgi:hypothetical protein
MSDPVDKPIRAPERADDEALAFVTVTLDSVRFEKLEPMLAEPNKPAYLED